jgi:hypothetical protein
VELQKNLYQKLKLAIGQQIRKELGKTQDAIISQFF